MSDLLHLGVLFDDPESLAAMLAPRVTRALRDGADVRISLDRRTARVVREILGADADGVTFPSPAQWPRDLAEDLRAAVRPGRPLLVIGQYTAAGVTPEQCAHREDAATIMLAGLPVTLLCTCERDADPGLVRTLRTRHPAMLVGDDVVPNPDHRVPAAHSPVDGGVWGPPTLRLEFRSPADLYRLREHVGRAAESVGLRGETAREAVLAAHEAAVLAAGGPVREAPGADPDAVTCVLELRTDSGALFCEVVGPGTGDVSGDPLHIVRLFCDRASLEDADDTRRIRLLRRGDESPLPAA